MIITLLKGFQIQIASHNLNPQVLLSLGKLSDNISIIAEVIYLLLL